VSWIVEIIFPVLGPIYYSNRVMADGDFNCKRVFSVFTASGAIDISLAHLRSTCTALARFDKRCACSTNIGLNFLVGSFFQ